MVKLKPKCKECYKTLFSSLINSEPILCSKAIEINMEKIFGNTTFKDTYLENGWILNITVSNMPRSNDYTLLNHLTTPDVTIRSAC